MVRSKALSLYGFVEPNDAMTRDASRGAVEDSNWIGRSFWVYSSVSMADAACLHGKQTSTNLPCPFSFTCNAKDVSSLNLGSLTRRKA